MITTIPYPQIDATGTRMLNAGLRSTSLHDVAYLRWLSRQVPGDILEIGCKEGRTLRELALANPGKTVWGVDYTDTGDTLSPQQKGEKPLPGRLGVRAATLPNVRVLNTKSADLATALAGSPNIGFIFIDGDHTYQGVKTDTELALKLLNPGGAIVWHDCYDGAPAWVGVKQYLTELSATRQIQQVDKTWLAVLRL